jgi:predicted O-methyltransferase YrrM
MLVRRASFFDVLGLDIEARVRAERLARTAADRAHGMCDLEDYFALAAILLHARPRSIFEIGTYLGVTSDFFLELLPDVRVASIAYVRPRIGLLGKKYNNSEIGKDAIGSAVRAEHRARFTQLYGDSHTLDAERMIREHGRFDLVFIDGDHTREGVAQDTVLARRLLAPGGTIAWHDANPKEKYRGVREFLERELDVCALATHDGYVGGVAVWSEKLAPVIA